MTDTNDTIPEIGENPTDADQAVTPIDTPVDEREDGETRPRPNESESCPVIHGGQPHPTTGNANSVWWPNQLNLKILAKNPAVAQPARRGLRLQGGVRGARPRGGQGRHRRDAHHVAGLVARRLRQLRPAHDPHGLAQRRHLPRDRRSRRRRRRSAALRSAQQLARQRQPRQGAPPAVAGQEEVRPVALVGRPHDPRRQRRARVDGLHDLRLRRWPPRCVGAGRRRLLGPRDHLAGRRALLGRPRAREAPRGRADGPHLRQPRGPERQPRPAGRRPATSARPSAAWRWTTRRPSRSSPVATRSARRTAPRPTRNIEDNPEAAGLEQQGLGWKNNHGTGHGDDTITSGLEVTWTYHPTRWDNEFFHILYAYEWELMRSPGGGHQWRPINGGGADMVPLAHSNGRREPRMLTSDLALRTDPAYDAISRRFKDDPEAFADAFARAWFKLTHRDMGPIDRYLGPEVPAEELLWQDRVPAVDHELIDAADAAALKAQILESGLTVSELVDDDVGGGILVPRQRQARRRQRRPHPPRPAEGLGGQQARPARDACSRSSSRSRRRSTTAAPTARRCRSPTSSCSPATRRVEKAAAGRGRRGRGGLPPGPHRCHAGADRRRSRSRSSSRSPTVPQLLRAARVHARGAPPHRPGEPAHAERSRADRARRRPARARCELGRLGLRRLHRPPGRAHERLLREPARPRHDVEAARPGFARVLGRARTARASPSASAPASTCCSARTRSSARSPRSTRADDANEKFVRDFVEAWGKVTELDRFDLV